MKFYYLPHHNGFASFSKNHFTLYNETQEAKSNARPTNNHVYRWIRYFQPINEILSRINYYQHNKYKTFQEQGLKYPDWLIT